MPIAGAIVNAGDQSAITDARGLHTLDHIKFKERVGVRIDAVGFATTFGIVDLFDRGVDADDFDSDSFRST